MLSNEENEFLTRVGPGTPMGQFFRQYWVPALMSSELPAADGPPIRVRLLGENLIAFRDSAGRVGLLADHCSHRGASLFFGRNEEGGLRCVYHGWKYDVEGRCVDMPNEPALSIADFGLRSAESAPAQSAIRNRHSAIKHTAYPCRERGGVIWTYMGGPRPQGNGPQTSRPDLQLAGPEYPPPLPNLEPNLLPEGEQDVWTALRECNWLQGLEGDIDTSHFGFLHGIIDPSYAPRPGTFAYYMEQDRAPRYSIHETEYGVMYGAYRPAEDDSYYWRIAQFLMPFFTMIPTGFLGKEIITRAWVPLDDEHTMFWSMAGGPDRVPATTLAAREMGRASNFIGPGGEYLPNTSEWLGRWRLAANRENDYLIDRELQRTQSFTGLSTVHVQDQMITESMGPVADRSREHLGNADTMVATVRQCLLQAGRALQERGVVHATVERPELYEVRSGGAVLPRDVDWLEATAEARKARMKSAE